LGTGLPPGIQAPATDRGQRTTHTFSKETTMPGFAIMPGDTATVLPSAAIVQAGPQSSQDVWLPRGAAGIRLIIDVSAVGGTPGTITGVTVDQKIGSVNNVVNYKTLYNFASLAINQAPVQKTLLIAPSVSQAQDDGYIPGVPPSQFRVTVTTLDNNSITYSVRLNALRQ
jgi:hypothetical protein